VFDHHPIKHAAGRILLILPFFSIFEFGDPMGALRMPIPDFLRLPGKLVWTGTWWTKLGIE